MREIFKDYYLVGSLVSMNKKNRTCRIKTNKQNSLCIIREYYLGDEFDFFSRYAVESDWISLVENSVPLSKTYVKSTKMQ